MADFLLAYHGGGMPASPEEGARVMAAWTAWFASMGDAVVDGGNPTSGTRRLAANGVVSDDPAGPSGYSIIRAASVEQALTFARGCPVLQDSGAFVQVAEIMPAM